ncbi:TraB/GumN family protein [Brevundimonas sp.]|uniref:TraB/GumN family protein n=1 Tax=Brevundimonas sp. TaxID=1871086 RepID=UPI0025DBF93E|nr:TraB/GumN family protein [Brevundimonas sp.]
MSIVNQIKSAGARLSRYAAGAALGLGLVVGLAPDPVLAARLAVQETPTVADPAIWVIRDADSTIYLFGTVHLMRPGLDWMTPKVRDAFTSADELWLELDDPSDQAAAVPLVQQYGISPQTPLSSLLTAEEFATLDTAARSMGLTGAAMEPMRPWLAGLTLSIAPLTRAGFDPAAGVDVMLRAQATERGLPIRGLETMEQQIRFFATMSDADQLAFLRQTLESYEIAAEMLDQLADRWTVGDMDGLFALGGAELSTQSRSFYDILLTNRNADWARQIQEELAGSGEVFIAVGALHLAGPDSVQEQLEDLGIRAERL